MIRIEFPYYLFALLVVPLITWLYFRYISWKRKSLLKFGESVLVYQLIPGRSPVRQIMKLSVLLLSFVLITIGLANLQSGGAKQTVKHEGIDIAVVLDASNSMLAEDVKSNRLEVARQFASQVINNLPDERIALITFAGTPLLLTPLTIDHGAVQLLLSNMSADNIPEQGTDIGRAINEAVTALPENQNHYRAILLISDGEDLEGTVSEAIEQASDEQIVICTAGVGTSAGTTIPVTNQGMIEQKRDEEGNVVITKFDADGLRNIAEKSHGIFVQLNGADDEALSSLLKYLDGIEKNEFDEEILKSYESRFRWFLIPALLLLIIELFISSKSTFWLKRLMQALKLRKA